MGRKFYPKFFAEIFANYEVEKSSNIGVEGYEDFERVFQSYRRWAFEPGAIDQYLARQFVGSAETIRQHIEGLVDPDFNAFAFNAHVHGVPRDIRRDCLKRLAVEIAPDFSSSFEPRALAWS